MDYYDVVRRNIKKYRKEKGITQEKLAELTGLSLNFISKIESIKMHKCFSLETLGRIADALNISIKDLFN